jgi:hypothetical protein
MATGKISSIYCFPEAGLHPRMLGVVGSLKVIRFFFLFTGPPFIVSVLRDFEKITLFLIILTFHLKYFGFYIIYIHQMLFIIYELPTQQYRTKLQIATKDHYWKNGNHFVAY